MEQKSWKSERSKISHMGTFKLVVLSNLISTDLSDWISYPPVHSDIFFMLTFRLIFNNNGPSWILCPRTFLNGSHIHSQTFLTGSHAHGPWQDIISTYLSDWISYQQTFLIESHILQPFWLDLMSTYLSDWISCPRTFLIGSHNPQGTNLFDWISCPRAFLKGSHIPQPTHVRGPFWLDLKSADFSQWTNSPPSHKRIIE